VKNRDFALDETEAIVSKGQATSTPFHGADGVDALQRIGQQWPFVGGNDDGNTRRAVVQAESLAAVDGRGST
jgi:hypothetical protein